MTVTCGSGPTIRRGTSGPRDCRGTLRPDSPPGLSSVWWPAAEVPAQAPRSAYHDTDAFDLFSLIRPVYGLLGVLIASVLVRIGFSVRSFLRILVSVRTRYSVRSFLRIPNDLHQSGVSEDTVGRQPTLR